MKEKLTNLIKFLHEYSTEDVIKELSEQIKETEKVYNNYKAIGILDGANYFGKLEASESQFNILKKLLKTLKSMNAVKFLKS